MSGVVQQKDFVIDQRHKFVDLFAGLNTGPHMVVQAHLHALLGGQAPQRVVAFGDALPLFLAEAGFCLAENRFSSPECCRFARSSQSLSPHRVQEIHVIHKLVNGLFPLPVGKRC